jgi:hypothetical protein
MAAAVTGMHTMRAHIAAAVIIAAWAAPAPALAQGSDLVANERISIDYLEPRHPLYAHGLREDDPTQIEEYKKANATYQRLMGVRQRLKDRRLLEEFSQFLAPLRLPVDLKLRTMECGQSNAFYDPTDSVLTLCYEYVAEMEDTAPKATTPEGITPQEAIVGQIVGTMLHEGGHAVSNLLQLPLLGREEDTADQIAGFVMLQFGPEVAQTLIKGEVYGWNQHDRRNLPLYWDVHSTSLQRQHTYLCLAYGRYPEQFQSFINNGWLPKARAPNCAEEYRQAERAFDKTIRPRIDQEKMRLVLQRKWLARLLPDAHK